LSDLLLEAHYVPADTRVLRRISEFGGVIPLTQEELSNLAGTSRATVNRVVRDAQARGELDVRRGRIEVIDPDALAARVR
jgi:CRP/FNR family cyclic AMP-dependent transcriptional regulator